jgi:hypothetical protein
LPLRAGFFVSRRAADRAFPRSKENLQCLSHRVLPTHRFTLT